jgi:DNA polymerase/3'-5' exonuclease PolX
MSTRAKKAARRTSVKSKGSQKDLFRDVMALVVSGLGDFETMSATVVNDKIKNMGGASDIITKSKKVLNIKKYTHILVPSNVTKEELSKYLKLASLDQISDKLIDYRWATDMIDQNKVLNSNDYIYTGGKKRRKTSEKLKKLHSPEPQPAQKTSKGEDQPATRGTKRKAAGRAEGKRVKKTPQKSTDVSEEEPDITKAMHNQNEHLTKHFQRLETFYRLLGDRGRSIAYANITRTLKMLPFHVKEASQLQDVEGFGDKTIKRIDEILRTGKLSQLKNMEKQKFIRCMEQFEKVHGIGIKKASQIYKKGITSMSELQQFAEQNPGFFSREQLLGIQYYNDLIQPVPRAEIEKIAEKVKSVISEINPEAELTITGSYRRGKPESGDVDFVIKLHSLRGFMNQLVSKLGEIGLIKEILKQSDKTLMSIAQFENNPCRRLDIKLCNSEAFPFMLLYFTGSFEYNRLLRTEAARKGYVLGNEGVHVRKTGKKVNLGAKTEEDIVRWLGMPVLSMEERDI